MQYNHSTREAISGKIRLIVLAAVAIAVYGCGREKPCYDNILSVMFVHYDSTEVDTFRLVKHPKISSPVSQTDTITVTVNNTSYRRFHDTIYVYSGQQRFMTKDFNWEVIVAQSLHGNKITDIINEQNTKRCGLLTMDCFSCTNHVVQYSINGQSLRVMDSNLGDYAIISKLFPESC